MDLWDKFAALIATAPQSFLRRLARKQSHFTPVKDESTFEFLLDTEIEQVYDPRLRVLLDEPVETRPYSQVSNVEPGHELVIMDDQDFLPVNFDRIYIRIHSASSFFGSVPLKNGFMKGLCKKSTSTVI